MTTLTLESAADAFHRHAKRCKVSRLDSVTPMQPFTLSAVLRQDIVVPASSSMADGSVQSLHGTGLR